MAVPGGPQAMRMEEAVAMAEGLQEQLEVLQGERQRLATVEAECRATAKGLERLGASDDDDIMVPVGAGTFIEAKLQGVERVITPIGSGVHVGLDVPGARTTIEDRAGEAKTAREAIEKNMDDLQARLSDLMGAIQAAQAGGLPQQQPPAAAPPTDEE